MARIWSYDDEVVFLKEVAKAKPLGNDKNSNLNHIVKAVNAVFVTPVTKKDITDKLNTLYDIGQLELLGSSSSSSDEKASSPGLDKSDDEDDDNEEDSEQETKRTVLTRSSTRKQTPDVESSEGTPKVRKSTRIRHAPTPRSEVTKVVSETDDDKEKENDKRVVNDNENDDQPDNDTEAVDDNKNDNIKDKDDSAAVSDSDNGSSEPDHSTRPKVIRKRTRSFAPAQTPNPSTKINKGNHTATVATPATSTRRSTRFGGPVVESTPSKASARGSTRKSVANPMAPTPATPSTSTNVVSTPADGPHATGRRRSMRDRKK